MLEKIAHIIGMSRQEIESQMKYKKSAFIMQRGNGPFRLAREQMEKVNQLNVLGIVAAEVRLRQTSVMNHLIGNVGENEREFQKRYGEVRKISKQTPIGISGLQQSFDEFLLTDGGKSIVSSGPARRTDFWKTSEIYITWKSILSSDDSNYFT